MGRVVHKKIYVASIFGGVGDGKKEMLRKKTHVVRKKTHVVRKFFYVASIFGGVARRRNRPPWELSSTPWELSSTAGDFSSTARRQRLQCVYRAPVFSGGAHTSLPDTNNKKARHAVLKRHAALADCVCDAALRLAGRGALRFTCQEPPCRLLRGHSGGLPQRARCSVRPATA